MGDSILRKYIKEILSEFFNNATVYPDDHNKFPYMDGSGIKTPLELDSKFDSEFESEEEPGDYKELEEKENTIIVPTFDGKKKGHLLYKIPNKH